MRDDFAKTFLIIALNVIVFERSRMDFEGGRIFRADPVVPPELQIFWRDFQCYMRGERSPIEILGSQLIGLSLIFVRIGNSNANDSITNATLALRVVLDKKDLYLATK